MTFENREGVQALIFKMNKIWLTNGSFILECLLAGKEESELITRGTWMPQDSKDEMEVMRQRLAEAQAELEELRGQNQKGQFEGPGIEGGDSGFFENSHAMMLLVDPNDGRIIDANPAATKYYGWSRDQMKQMVVMDVNVLSKEEVQQEMQEAKLARRNHFFFKHRLADGSIRDVEVYSGLTRIGDQEFLYSIVHDITKRRYDEEAKDKRLIALTRPMEDVDNISFEALFNLDDIQKLQDQFAEATGVASLIILPDGTPITMPSRFCRFCNDFVRKSDKGMANCHKSDAIIGRHQCTGPIVQRCLSGGLWDAGAAITIADKHIASWLVGQVRDEAQSDEMIRQYAREIEVDEEELLNAYHEIPSMSREQFEKIANVLYTLANQLSESAYQNMQQARFITERKRAEDEHEKLRGQLAQSQKMESVGRLAGGVAHDFNNMLHVILGHAELALDGLGTDHPLRTHLEEIESAAQRSADLTRQLLAFARRQTVAPKFLNLNDVIGAMLKMLARLIGEDIELVWKPAEVLEAVRIDPSQIDQVLANLVVNARDAIEGGGKVVIETGMVEFSDNDVSHPDLRPGRYVVLVVSDDGHGMSERVRKQIFDPFYTTKEVGEGTGLGLSTVYGIVQQNKGDISVSSEPGRGATFKIYLPAHKTGKESSGQDKGSDVPGARKGECILLVEDELTNLRMTEVFLGGLGYEVYSASTPGEAIELAEEHLGKLDLLLTDVIMPEMDGLELSKELVKMCPTVKCLFMSGYTAETITRRGILDEGKNFISKPFSRQSLSQKVREVLDQ